MFRYSLLVMGSVCDCYRYDELHSHQMAAIGSYPKTIQTELKAFADNVCSFFGVKRTEPVVSKPVIDSSREPVDLLKQTSITCCLVEFVLLLLLLFSFHNEFRLITISQCLNIDHNCQLISCIQLAA